MTAITEKTYVDEAERVIKKLSSKTQRNGRPDPMVTTSKLRNLLAMTTDIYNAVEHDPSDPLSEEVQSRIEYLRIRFIYECGREQKVKELVEEAGILDILKNIKGSRKAFMLYSRYMEALVAFHRYYGGKD